MEPDGSEKPVDHLSILAPSVVGRQAIETSLGSFGVFGPWACSYPASQLSCPGD